MISEFEVRKERDMLQRELEKGLWDDQKSLVAEKIDAFNYVLSEGDWEWKAEE